MTDQTNPIRKLIEHLKQHPEDFAKYITLGHPLEGWIPSVLVVSDRKYPQEGVMPAPADKENLWPDDLDELMFGQYEHCFNPEHDFRIKYLCEPTPSATLTLEEYEQQLRELTKRLSVLPPHVSHFWFPYVQDTPRSTLEGEVQSSDDPDPGDPAGRE